MKTQLQVVPQSAKAKLVPIVWGQVILALLALKFAPELFWPFVALTVAFVIYKLNQTAADRAWRKDNPGPVVYNCHAAGVLGQLEKAIKIIPPQLDDVSARINHLEPEQSGSEPLHVQAIFTLEHPELYEVRDELDPRDKSLRSELLLDAYIKPMGSRSEVTLHWTASPITTRAKHDEVIDAMTAAIDELIRTYIKAS